MADENPREAFYRRAEKANLSPLWEILGTIAANEPRSQCTAAIWRYSEVRPYLVEASTLISAEEAERRVMILQNPGLNRANRITQSMYAGLQVVLPGETAPSHRHVANALRFIIEGGGAFTRVNGEKTYVQPGDFVITPGWAWHDHGNETDEPVVWLDGLDIQLINFLDAGFFEGHSPKMQLAPRAEGSSYRAHGFNMRPIDYEPDPTGNSPIFNYPYRVSRETLDHLSRDSEIDRCHGFKMRFVNPDNGGWAIPTMSTCIQLLPGGTATEPYRSTDSTVFSVVEGSGYSVVGEERFDWSDKDIFVVPSWTYVRHRPDRDAVLFSYSDRAVQEKLNVWREQRGSK